VSESTNKGKGKKSNKEIAEEKMTDERAVELFLWAPHHAKPPMKNYAEYTTAIEHVRDNPHLWPRIWRSEDSNDKT
jgi:hypothetical protein